MLHTILGSGGAIGLPLARELKTYTNKIRLVSRNPKKVNDTDELLSIDATVPGQVDKAIYGSSVVYVTIGFEYNVKVWQKVWIPFMNEVITACKKHNAKLVFFDNVYSYSKDSIPDMTEESAMNPPSEKGKIRAAVSKMIMDQWGKNNFQALIVRSADFYGHENKNSLLYVTVAENLMKGKKALLFGNADKIHTYTYIPDAAKATAILGNTADAYNQVWHVPTTKEKLTNLEWINSIAKELNTPVRIQKVSKWMVYALGLFVPVMREFTEMVYQFEQDYIFDSSKFENRFGIFATPPEEGIRKMISRNRS